MRLRTAGPALATALIVAIGITQAQTPAPSTPLPPTPKPVASPVAPVTAAPAPQAAPAPVALPAPAAISGPLTAGASKVAITPLPTELVAKTDLINDPLYARVIVVSNGVTCAVLVGLDLGGARNDMIADVMPRLVSATGCPSQNILISATHTHSSNTGGLGGQGSPTAKRVADAIIAAAAYARGKMRPATVGFGTTQVSLNTNRDLFTKNGEWRQQPNPNGPSDKTLAVAAFIGEDHVPIGVYMNYAMHPINFYLSGVISADFPGAASRTVEELFDDKPIAIFAQAASGDQNPLYSERSGMTRIRTGQGVLPEMIGAPPPPPSTALNPVAEMTAKMKEPVAAADLPAYRRAVARAGLTVDAMGSVIAQAAVNVMRTQMDLSPRVAISGASRQFSCPGRERLDLANPARENVNPGYKDSDPVNIKVGVLRIGNINFVGVNGEVYSEIGMRLKKESPQPNTLMVTLANGAANSGYIYSDAASKNLTFQVIGSRLKPACAEDNIVSNAVAMIGEANR